MNKNKSVTIEFDGTTIPLSLTETQDGKVEVASEDGKFKSILNGSELLIFNKQGYAGQVPYDPPTADQEKLFKLIKASINSLG